MGLFQRTPLWLKERKAQIAADHEATRLKDAGRITAPARFNPLKEAWPPKWKPIRKSPQYRNGMITRFVDCVWDLETLIPDIDDSQFPPDKKTKDIHANIKRFLKIVRESRGYDVDWIPPNFVGSPFYPMSVDKIMLDEEHFMQKMKYVMAEINTHAELHGKCYELDKIEKLVEARGHRTSLLTFSVKDVAPKDVNGDDVVKKKTIQAMVFSEGHGRFKLVEWRFRPEDGARASIFFEVEIEKRHLLILLLVLVAAILVYLFFCGKQLVVLLSLLVAIALVYLCLCVV